jgi:hypothetical protein
MVHPDLNELLNTLLPFAQQMLTKHGEFFPFGARVAVDGSVVHCGAHDGDEQPPSQRLIELLTQAFRQQASAGEIRAAGICFDVRITPPGQSQKTDAIQLALEHESGEVRDVFLPYRREVDGSLHYGELFAGERDAQFFTRAGAA